MSSTGQGGTPGTAVGGSTGSSSTPTRSGTPAGAPSGAPSNGAAPSGSAPTAPTPTVRPGGPSGPVGGESGAPGTATPYRPSVAPSGAGASGAAVGAAAGAAGAATATRPQSRSEASGRVPRSGPQGQQRRAGQGQPPRQGAPRRVTTRRVKLAIARVDPWSVMKMSFLLAVAAGIAGVVLTAVLWLILSGMGVFSDIDRVVGEIQPSTTTAFTLMNYIGFGRVVSLSIVLGVIDIILMTALATLAAFLYNICSALVGGIQLTLTDD